ncbi:MULTISPECIES: hydrogen peroxide-inducible genes activator [unclassified Mesorhizobium]|uniref:hydrogen peroxide-inducible genes activator n=1 Tax=unclassified Mesorhizobium TaxID=325217 RepID=UPI00112D447A|nr:MULTISPECIES: hydrogen peroxide-inducible genes activator [unclassified Mesorhizobium]MBZ9896123.1 hydrogen peroxide-inducible genes activator [Mesorhizobium sp. BR1-1-6]TPK60807.1 hydrogen peroxide-inducible genes activator [Mesorhizobium sp. B2-5-1]TPM07337.1 hydrogen peroxide-inducible genes activator [Mesorhizobium sp. B2-3-8]TPM16047.1 hydrogen peroxide-inducible genes activator [Mesorhizobium sp. B2-3-7]TPM48385.1 hydrogen peroxide-inducible genes activator [Mesorhizobium sp. B2-2-3]
MIGLTVRQMHYFDALAQTLHFGRAAKLAGVSQPALSSQIAEMEQRLNCRLFERGGKSVRMTDEAAALLPRIERILSDIREVETIARRGRPAMGGRFRLGIIPTVAPYLLPRALPELKMHFPDLMLELREAVTASLVEDIASQKLDAFIAALPLDHPGLVTEALFPDRFFLAVPSGDPAFASPPVPPESPALERLMLLEEGHCLREQALAVCGNVRPVAMASYGATSLTTLLQMVAHGLGVTLIPEMATGPAGTIPDLKIVPFQEPMPQRTICFAWRRNSTLHNECRELAKIIRGLAAAVQAV